jgi:hypothetical protein
MWMFAFSFLWTLICFSCGAIISPDFYIETIKKDLSGKLCMSVARQRAWLWGALGKCRHVRPRVEVATPELAKDDRMCAPGLVETFCGFGIKSLQINRHQSSQSFRAWVRPIDCEDLAFWPAAVCIPLIDSRPTLRTKEAKMYSGDKFCKS